ncbi:MAG TPA: chromate transporter [Stellaceae bacterium]|jgi:chromate transporter|nr:chromate transporter [Stellaceae bacterium]
MRDGFSGTLLALFAVFAPLSLLSFGGGNATIADIAHQSVAVHHWTGDREFADLFALSRAAPGPGSMLCALIGWKAAGVPGAIVATVAFYLPASFVLFVVAKVWGRWRGSVWHQAVERGIAPIAAGLFLSGGLAVLRVTPAGLAAWIAAGLATAALLYWPKLHPMPLLIVSGAVFGLIDLLGVRL